MFKRIIKFIKEIQEIRTLKKQWICAMCDNHLYNKRKETFGLNDIKKTDVGYTAIIESPNDLNGRMLLADNLRKYIKDNYKYDLSFSTLAKATDHGFEFNYQKMHVKFIFDRIN